VEHSKKISEFDFTLAEIENESFVPVCIQDEYNQKVQRLFIAQENGVTLTANDSSYLETVACLDPVLNGSGVYQARTMLGWVGSCTTNVNFKSATEQDASNIIEKSHLDFRLYPNPNNGDFYLVYTIEEDAILFILDITGKVVLQNSLSSLENMKRIYLNQESGVYIYRVIDINGKTETGKFVIQ
jgi:hypothetical protein